MQWTAAQRSAIEARGSNLLVSAAAGSGKTAVLTERILSLVQEGTRIDDLLVVTFTKAAAAEMRARIMASLQATAAETGDPHLAAQTMRVEQADITTLHGFCAQLCRDHFQAAAVDPTFRIADGAEASMLRAQALTDALTACYERHTSLFAHAAECLTQDALAEATNQLHRFLMARPDPWSWLQEAVAAHYVTPASLQASPWMAVLLQRIRQRAQAAVDAYDRLIQHAVESGLFLSFAEQEAAKARRFLDAAADGYDALMALEATVFDRRPPKRKDMDPAAAEAFGALRDEAKAALKSAEAERERIRPLTLRAEDETGIGLVLAGLAEAATDFDARFSQLKEERNLLDFGDLEHRALKALSDPSVAQAVRQRYRYIFVDEYQDSSLLQEALLAAVHRPGNLFMVGDVKQSIYRFRLAEPTLFMEKLRAYQPTAGAPDRRIALNANFRSHPCLLAGINAVFEHVFCGGAMELPYGEEERLVPGGEADWGGALPELHLLETDATDNENGPADEDALSAETLSPQTREAIQREAEIIADRIHALVHAPEGGYRLRDMAILMRTVRGKAAQMVEVLRSRGIAAWSDLGENALERIEIQQMTALLQAIDNARQDVPLLAALRGPAMRLSDESLAAIRATAPEGTFAEAAFAYAEREDALALALRDFFAKLRAWALDAQAMPMDRFLRAIYEQTGLYAEAGAHPDGEQRQANLRMLAEHAGTYQAMQAGGLSGFLRYLARIRAQEGLSTQDLGEGDDVVRVLSIHKSKGLQFPVVFVAGLGRRFRSQDTKSPLQLHNVLGAGMPHVDAMLRTRRETLSQQAILEKRRQEAIAEEARILYVAMTRAEKRLVLIGSAKQADTARWLRPLTAHAAQEAASMLDWVAPIALTAETWLTCPHTGVPSAAAPPPLTTADHVAAHARSLPAPSPASETVRALTWKPDAWAQRPLKQSVSSVVQAQAKEGERSDSPDTLDALPKRPLFMETRGLTAAERGDAVHAFLRAVPFDAQDLTASRRSMQDSGILSPEQAEALPIRRLQQLTQSALWQRMQASPEVHREWPFILPIRNDGGTTLLQGVIDCCFWEADAWVLVDYKTDHITDLDALVAHYTPQVHLYANALHLITGKPVKEQYLYFIERNVAHAV